jgi:hypothetical protein
MVILVKFQYRPHLKSVNALSRHLALAAASLLNPLSMIAGVLGCWRLGADLNWTGEFAISKGFFSHWQVWMVLAAAMQIGSIALNRYAHSEAANEALS